ncbi:MAG: hypothetical protein U5L73_11255 [Rhodoferax sp.]|uniref:hypothetical protein n=1 Tax=Rhodoferax sp. TaxID=50421 RepID=UPI002ACDC66E|nr:hypothetical protein [Rhodoferax sp.]MDZ7892319.1 hypothetical protein [Rhodoferax sp.]
MTFGFIAKGDNGALLASSDSANYEFAQRLTVGSVAGNVTTYTFSAVDYPMFFIEVPIGGKAGILDSTSTQVRIIGDGAYPVNVFKRVSSAAGFGVAAFDPSEALTFKAGAQTLNVRAAGAMGIGGSFTGAGSMVSFPALASITERSASEADVYYAYYVYTTFEQTYVCRDEFQCNTDYQGNFSCGYVTVCGYEMIRTDHTVDVIPRVRTTNWALKRSVARRTGPDTYVQDWVVHTSGFYKDVVAINYFEYSFSPSAPPGYNPPPFIFDPGSSFTGAFGFYSKDNTFPYSNGQTKAIAASILTS